MKQDFKIPFGPAIPLQRIYPKEKNQKNVQRWMLKNGLFIIRLFFVVKNPLKWDYLIRGISQVKGNWNEWSRLGVGHRGQLQQMVA